MAFIDNRRKIDITIISIENLNHNLNEIIGKKITFSYNVYTEKNIQEMTELPFWIQAELKKLCLIQPKVSGKSTVKVYNSDNKQETMTVLIERYIDLTVGQILDLNAELYPNREAIVDVTGQSRYTYDQLKKTSDNLAKTLIQCGIQQGNNVAVIMTSSQEQIVSKLAITKAGAVVVNISVYEKHAIFEKLMLQLDIVAVIMKTGPKTTENIDMLYDICPELKNATPGELNSKKFPSLKTVIIADSKVNYPGTYCFEDLIPNGSSLPDNEMKRRMESVSYNDVATIIHTSGTTGLPKGVMLTHNMIIENAWSHILALKLTKEDRICMPIPMFHAFGCIGVALTSILTGTALIIVDRANCNELLSILEREKCNVLCSVPTAYIGLINTVQEMNYDMTKICLQKCVVAGAQCSEKMLNDITEILGIKDTVVMYGMTEASPGISSTRLGDPVEIRTKTVGALWPGTEIKFVDVVTGKDIAKGAQGEICIRGYNVMKGYYMNPAKTSEAVDNDGWLHTGDVGAIREDGNLCLDGRCKEIIIKNGENICPKEIEDCLMENEAIMEAYVVGAPNYKSGEIVVAFIKLKHSYKLTSDDIKKYCKNKISSIKIPSSVKFVEEFPTSPTGKVLKKELCKMAMNI